jgi:hypothetical protein
MEKKENNNEIPKATLECFQAGHITCFENQMSDICTTTLTGSPQTMFYFEKLDTSFSVWIPG